tara:strand:- start:696 stop:809 length:114 start_codon:yes stop_codon:yes gene_type:complete
MYKNIGACIIIGIYLYYVYDKNNKKNEREKEEKSINE